MEQEEIIKIIREKSFVLFILLVLLLVGLVFFCQYFFEKQNISLSKEVKTENLEQDNKLLRNTEKAYVNKFDERIDRMSFEQKIGQILLTSLDGEELTISEFNLLKEGSVSGLLLFSKNTKNEEQVKELTSEIYNTATAFAYGIIPIVAVDQEGGKVSRIDWIEKTSQSEIKDEKQAYEIAIERGKQLKDLGIWMNFSPVVECGNFEEDNFMKRQNRGFLNNCKELSLAMINGYKKSGILGVVKHFPDGLIKTNEDPHLVLPEIDLNREEIDLNDYKDLIEKGIESLMVTHLTYPMIDGNITSKSKIFMRDILRQELGFGGLVVVDDLSMKAVVDNYDLGKFVIESVKNGGDLFIVSNRKDYEYVFEYLVKNGEEDGEFVERLDESVNRILRVKEKYGN